jgi:hypothetical protein
MRKPIGPALILVSSAAFVSSGAFAGGHMGGGGGHASASSNVSHAPAHSAAVEPSSSHNPRMVFDSRRENGAKAAREVDRLCSASDRSANKCLDRGWNVTVR